MKILLFALLFALPMFGQTGGGPLTCIQQPNSNCYEAYKETSLSSSTEKITVQAAGTITALNVYPLAATVYCSAAADITLSQNGTAATTTTLAVTPLNVAVTGTATAYSASNVGAGNTVDKVSIPTGGGTFVWDLSKMILWGGTTSQNISVGTSSVTATCRIKILWVERNT